MQKKRSPTKISERFHTVHVIEKSLRHHIIEWAAAVLSTIGAVLNAQLNIYGFVFFSIANFLWMSFSIKHKHWGLLLTNLVYFVLNLYGIYVWAGQNI